MKSRLHAEFSPYYLHNIEKLQQITLQIEIGPQNIITFVTHVREFWNQKKINPEPKISLK